MAQACGGHEQVAPGGARRHTSHTAPTAGTSEANEGPSRDRSAQKTPVPKEGLRPYQRMLALQEVSAERRGQKGPSETTDKPGPLWQEKGDGTPPRPHLTATRGSWKSFPRPARRKASGVL